MALTPEQIKELKHQLSEQIQHLPPEQKAQAQKQIDALSPEALETMLHQQQSQDPQPQQSPQNQEIYRSIISGNIPSLMIDQNKQAIAVLEIKPISKGHTIIIPKNQVKNTKDLPSQALTLAKKVAKKLSSKLKASSSEIQTQSAFGEIIINVIPIYDKPLNLNSPRSSPPEDELEDLYKKLKSTPRKKVIKKSTKPKSSNVIKLKRRVP